MLEALEAAGAGAGAVAIRADALEGSEPALRRLALRALAERATGRAVPLGRRRAAEIMRLAAHPEGGEVDLGHGVRAICEHGLIRFVVVLGGRRRTRAGLAADPGQLPLRALGGSRGGLPGARSSRRDRTWRRSTPGRSARSSLVRTWREGDRMRPLGMDGTKTLQDLFTDRGVPALAAASPARRDRGRSASSGSPGWPSPRTSASARRPTRPRCSRPASWTTDRERLRRLARCWCRTRTSSAGRRARRRDQPRLRRGATW